MQSEPSSSEHPSKVRIAGHTLTVAKATVILRSAATKDLQLFFITFHSAISAYDQCMHEGSYCTCMMASRSRTLYIGVTGDLLKRVFQHKWKEHEGFAARYSCDRLVWFERRQDTQRAITREKELKGWRRGPKNRQ